MAGAKVAFLILSNDPARVLPGLTMARRLKENRGAEVRVLFFAQGVRLAASGALDDAMKGLVESGVSPKSCSALVEQYGLKEEYSVRPIELLAAGAEVESFAAEGFTVLSF